MSDKGDERSASVAQQGASIYDEYSDKVPEKYRKYAETIRPAVLLALKGVDVVLPYLPKLWDFCEDAWRVLLPYWEELGIVWGFVLAFFGGSFLVTITAVEAFRLVGKQKIVASWMKIEDDLRNVVRNYQETSSEDEKLTSDQWMRKHGHMVLRTVDPEDCRAAAIGFYTGFAAVLACLRNQFAQVVALGVSIGEVLEDHVGPSFVLPLIKAMLPDEHLKWAPLLMQVVCRLPAVAIAWFLQRVISAFHSAMRGGHIIARCCLSFAKKRSLMHEEPSQQVKTMSAAMFAFLGLSFQLTYGFGLPWFLAVPLAPFVLAEYVLSYLIIGF